MQFAGLGLRSSMTLGARGGLFGILPGLNDRAFRFTFCAIAARTMLCRNGTSWRYLAEGGLQGCRATPAQAGKIP
jgi:hypothetical protein